jgi:hypothetical protein
VERLQGYLESNFEPGRWFANHLDFQLQLHAWFQKANSGAQRMLRARAIDRVAEKQAVMRALPASGPDVDRRWVIRVPPGPICALTATTIRLTPSSPADAWRSGQAGGRSQPWSWTAPS